MIKIGSPESIIFLKNFFDRQNVNYKITITKNEIIVDLIEE
jgi:hypothetical protein